MLYSNAVRKNKWWRALVAMLFGGVGGEYPSQDGNDIDIVRVKRGIPVDTFMHGKIPKKAP
jgi:hypothetical protein